MKTAPYPALAILAGVLAYLSAPAAVSYDGGLYTQTFDSLGSGAVTWTNNSTLAGWYAHQSAGASVPSSLNAPLAAGTGTGSGSKGYWFNFGNGADRALGGSPASGTGTISYGVALTNNTGSTLTGFDLSFDWERWFTADISSTQNLRLSYSTDATSLTTGAYTEIPAGLLTYTAPGGSTVWLASPEVQPRSVSVSGISWAPGTRLWLRWQDINESGGDHGTGIDNVSFSADGSSTPPPAATVQLGPWSGAITTTTARVNVKMDQAASGARLAVSTNENFTSPQFILPDAGHATGPIAAFSVDGLPPDTLHHYAIEVGGQLDLARRGTFRTFPTSPAAFTFVFAACADTGSDHRVFDHIAQQEPLFYLNIGDLHYADIAVNNPALFRSALDSVFNSPRQSALYRAVPFAYMWDDHDFGPNDSDSQSPGRPAALQVYREYIPHYPLSSADAEAPVDQSFTVGRLRFVLTDLRSRRDPKSQTDNAQKRMLSAAQLQWFQQEVLDAQAAGQAVFWVSTVPWIESPATGSDMWGGYSTQRREIANFLAANHIANLVILAGDSHMLAADNGANANFSDYPAAPPIRVLQAAALDRAGSVKGGPYSQGTFSGGGQYGHVTVTDQGDQLHVLFSGRRIDPVTGAMTERLSYGFTLPMGSASSGGSVNLAPHGTMSAYSSQQGGNEATKLIDDSLSQRWAASGTGYPQWVEVDLGANRQIHGTEVHTYLNRDYRYRIEVRPSGGTYTTVADRTANTLPGPIVDSFALTTARYVRITVTGAHTYTGNWVSLYELKIMGADGTAPLAITGVTASAQQTGNEAVNTIDGSFTTRWAAQGIPNWIRWDLGSTQSVQAARLSFYNLRQYEFSLEASTNGTTWTTVLNNQTSSGVSEAMETFTFPSPVDARYFRYIGAGSNVNDWNSLWEAELISN